MSRDLAHLTAEMAAHAVAHESRLAEQGWDLLVYSTRRTYEEQARLFRQGRPYSQILARAELLRDQYDRRDLYDVILGVGPQHGKRVTNAAPGQSAHNPVVSLGGRAVAYDAVPMKDGVPLWQWRLGGKIAPWWKAFGDSLDLGQVEWGGLWRRVDGPHVQIAGWDWKEFIRR